tara:strand:+ start:645 stop:881 length:237 start_codon:yes stop_codon:yes gene_type:complete
MVEKPAMHELSKSASFLIFLETGGLGVAFWASSLFFLGCGEFLAYDTLVLCVLLIDKNFWFKTVALFILTELITDVFW